MKRVVDTSVVVKWLVDESGSPAAAALIGQDLLAPDWMLTEVASAAWKKWRRGEIGAELARVMPESAASFVTLVPASPFADAALALAIELKHPVYDCIFLALAEQTGRRLVTADRRLILTCQESRFAPLVEPLEPAASQ